MEPESIAKFSPGGHVPEDPRDDPRPYSVLIDSVDLAYKVRAARRPRGKRAARSRAMKSRTVRVDALRGVAFGVREGEFLGVVGTNGSGKSSLLRVIAGAEAPNRGEVRCSGTPSLLGVNAALIPELTGNENITLGCLALGLDGNRIREARRTIREFTGLGDALTLPMRTYSQGMAARLRFAISVVAEPEILLVDEALATGDAAFLEKSKRAMDSLLERAGTVLLVSHAAETIENMCTRAVWINNGEFVEMGPAREVARRYRVFAQRLADGDSVAADRILAESREQGRATHDMPCATQESDSRETPPRKGKTSAKGQRPESFSAPSPPSTIFWETPARIPAKPFVDHRGLPDGGGTSDSDASRSEDLRKNCRE